jgi:predicted amino acid-binding ACT domain protein
MNRARRIEGPRRKGVFEMNFSNIWNHPKTSAAGLLIAVASIAGVLSQQGITLGKAGTGTVVSLVTALATALLGLLANDPEGASQSAAADRSTSQQAKLGAWMLIALLIPLPWMQGCTAIGVAQDIVNWTPALQSAVATVDSTAALLAPADAPIFTAATSGFDAVSNLLVAQAKAYLANPSTGILAQLQTQIVTLQQQVNAALLQAGRIVDAASQQHALAAVQAVGTIASSILSLVASISSKAAVAHMAAQTSVKLSMVRPYLDDSRAAQIVAAHYGEPVELARMQVAHVQQAEINAGF